MRIARRLLLLGWSGNLGGGRKPRQLNDLGGDLGDRMMTQVGFERCADGSGTLTFSGAWALDSDAPDCHMVISSIGPLPGLRRIGFETGALTRWDSTFIAAVLAVMSSCSASGIAVDPAGLPVGAQRLVDLATAVPERKGARRNSERKNFFEKIGTWWLSTFRSWVEATAFVGEAAIAIGRLVAGRANFRRLDLMIALEQCGPKALPIVTLISVLIGLILAFVGAIQLRQFGAQIYVADLVAIAMSREMAAIMTGIIMAGRTGAAFAAQLGTMQVNEEIDAFRTLGFSPIEFLVLPRMIALIVMMPLLTIYSNVLGIIGGGIVTVGMLGLTPKAYYVEMISSVGLGDFAIGVFKGAVFGTVVALVGCFKGIHCGRSASAVGEAATGAVVLSIVLIIVLDGIFAVITSF